MFPAESGCAQAGIDLVDAATPPPWRRIPDGTAKTNGIDVGQAAAAAIVAARAADHANDAPLVDTSPRGGPPGEYEFTPGTPFAFAPKWGAVTPFMLRDSTQFASGPPYPLTSRRYAADFDEVKRLGGGGDGDPTPSARTAEQTQIALFWLESSPLAWNRMARGIVTDRRARRMGGRPSVRSAQHGDGRRLHRNVPGEVQLQLLASGDRHPPCGRGRQPAHVAGPRLWQPLVGTPPIPDHDSGHSVEGGVAAEVMRRVLGTDRVRFTGLQPHAAGRADVRRPDAGRGARSTACPTQQPRTASRECSSGSTSATPSMTGSPTVGGSERGPCSSSWSRSTTDPS